MNDSDNNVTKVIIGLIIAVLVIVVGVYAYNLLKDDNSMNDVKNDMNQVGQDIYNGTGDLIDGTGEVVGDVVDSTDKALGDVANGVKNTVDNIIDFTMTDNAIVENNMKTNTSEKIKTDKKYENLVIKEVTLIGKDNATTFTAKIKNDSNTDFTSKKVTITFLKNDKKTITSKEVSIPNIKAGETTDVTVTMNEDVANAYDYIVE